MKRLFLVCAIIVQSLGWLCADAKINQQNIFRGESHVSAFSVPDEEPSSLKRTLKISRSHIKIRIARNFAAVTELSSQPEAIYDLHSSLHSGYASPFYLPLTRLLLFPKHYFW